jgi:hypothetical protein
MDFWGCEFLDLESHSEFTNNKQEKEQLYFPTDFLAEIADKKYISNIIRKDAEYIERLKVDIANNGLLKDLKVTVGTNGMMLGDGHHRLCAMTELGYEYIPVHLKISSHNLKVGSSYFKIIERILKEYGKKQEDINRGIR